MQSEDKTNLDIVMNKPQPDRSEGVFPKKSTLVLIGLISIVVVVEKFYPVESSVDMVVAPAIKVPVKNEAGNNNSKKVSSVFKTTGYAKSVQEATVSSKATGRLAELFIEEGQEIEKGEVIAKLDSYVFANRLEVARHNHRLAKAHHGKMEMSYQKIEKQFNRISPLHKIRMIDSDTFDEAKSNLLIAKQNVLIANLELQKAASLQERAELELGETYIRAPFSGVVVTLNAEVGEIVSPISAGGGYTRTGIATIVDLHRLVIEVEVPEQKLPSVALGQVVNVDFKALDGDKYAGVVKSISPWVSQSRTVLIKVALQNTDKSIFPNMSAQISFVETARTGVKKNRYQLSFAGGLNE